jgi:glycosyltransferase involved in cell wall biosynthesis
MIFDMRGFWADEKVDNGQWNLKKPFYQKLYRFYKKKEKAFLLNSDGIVSLTHKAKFYLLQQPVYSRLHIDVIPCCADLEHFDYNKMEASSVKELKQQLLMPSGAKVLTYLGSVGGWYMTREMFRFFLQLLQQCPEYVLLILTKDNRDAVTNEAIAEGVPPEKLFVRYAARKELPLYLALSTCSVFFIRNTFSKMASSPTKHAELMGMGIPVICNEIGDTGQIIRETKTGILIERFSMEDLKNGIAAVAELEQLDKSYIRTNARRLFDLNAGVEKYGAVYNRVLEGEGALAK